MGPIESERGGVNGEARNDRSASDAPPSVGRPTGDEPIALEGWLRERLRGRSLVVEAGIDEELLVDLQVAVAALGTRMTTSNVAVRYPASFIGYLTAHGIFRYAAGGFWNHEPLRLHHPQIVDDVVRALKALRLESFDRMVAAETSQSGVSRILGHGGIPAYCLDDFFEVLVGDVPRTNGSAADLMAFWHNRPSRFVHADKPIKRFLDYGGPIAADFLDRCIDLVEATAESGAVPAADDTGLPDHVVAAFRKFTAERPGGLRAAAKSDRVPRPVLRIDPWSGESPHVAVAPVAVNRKAGRWRVFGGAGTSASTLDWQTLPVGRATSWTVSFADAIGRQEWTFTGLDPDVPVLAFDPTRFTLIDLERGVTAADAILLLPHDATVETIGSHGSKQPASEIEDLPRLSGDWSSFRYRWISLEDVSAIRVTHQSSVRSVPVRSPESSVQLVGEPLAGVTIEGLPVYAQAPTLRVPTGTGLAPSAWSVRLTVGDDVRRASVADLPARGTGHDLGGFLPPDQATPVHLVARGPLGSDLRERFVLVPNLVVHRPTRLVFPGDSTAAVEVSAPGYTTGSGEPLDRLRIRVGGDESAVAVDLVGGASRTLPLRVAVDKLLWSVNVGDRALDRFTGSAAFVPFDDVVGPHGPVLKVRCGEQRPELMLQLVDADQQVLRETERISASSVSGSWTFHLDGFADTLRSSTSSTHELVLWVGAVPVTVARITAPITARDLAFDCHLDGSETSVRVTFDDPRPGRDRALFLWPLARPWSAPLVAPMAEGVTEVAASAPHPDLPPGPYLGQIAVDDGWTTPSRPTSCASAAVVRIDVGTPEDVHAYVESLPLEDPHHVAEMALLGGESDRRFTEEEIHDLAPDLVEAVIAMHELEANDVRVPHGYLLLRSVLRVYPAAVASGFNEFASRHPSRRDHLLRLALAILPRLRPDHDETVVPEAMEELWQTCPPVAARLDLVAAPGDERRERMSRFLGWDSTQSPELVAADRALEQAILGMPPEALEAVLAGSTLVPERLLDGGTAQEAQAEWVIANATVGPETDEWGRTSTLAERWMAAHRSLSHRLDHVPEVARHHVVGRLLPNVGTSGPLGWGSLPAITLAAALHLVTDDPDRDGAVAALESAIEFAPSLVGRDLVLAQVLLPPPSPDAPPIAGDDDTDAAPDPDTQEHDDPHA